jgi:hypothetical protein
MVELLFLPSVFSPPASGSSVYRAVPIAERSD